jgi:ubiquinone/menaquinone biosynthesis C-methylase UbiE
VPEHDASAPAAILPVSRSKKEARLFYDRVSRIYDWLTATSEREHSQKALELLSVGDGESVLEIGIGSGRCLQQIAKLVGVAGRCCGIDISTGMLEVTRNRLRRSGLSTRAEVFCADGARLPFQDNTFDAILMAFTLELFDTPEIPAVLEETKRVLKPGSRIAVASLSKEGKGSVALGLYEWAHQRWPRYADCRPIYVERSLTASGYIVSHRMSARMSGLPVETAIARKPESAVARHV